MAEPAATHASALPADAWPVPRQDVLGNRGGLLAWIEYAAARGLLGTLSRLPEAPREALVSAFARLAHAADRSHSDAARTFLRQALGDDLSDEDVEARVRQSWRHFLRVTIENAGFPHRVDLAHLDRHLESVELHPDVERVRRERTGCLFVTGHIGDWEAGSAVLAWLGFRPLYVVAKPPRNRPLSRHLQDVREERNLRVLPRRGAMQHAGPILRAGGALALVLDQRSQMRAVMAPFFGRLARCDRSAGVLVRRLRVPVIVGACYRAGPWRWRMRLPCVIQPEDFAGASPEAVATRINRELETLIRAAPEQYFWLHDRYRGAGAVVDEADGEDPTEDPGT